MFKLESKESIAKQIGSVGRAGMRLIAAIQTVATQVIAHAVKHGDITLANSLLDATSKHQRATLVAFLETYGPFQYVKSDKAFKHHKHGASAPHMGGDLPQEYVDALPKWDSMVKAPEPKSVFDVSEECDKFITRMRKVAADADNTVKNQQLLEQLMATYNRYQAAQYLDETNLSPEMDARTPEGAAELEQFPALKSA